MAEIFVIVINWNGKHFLDVCLTALRRQTFRDFETVLVENGSSDGSADFVQANFPEVELIRLGENLGFTGGNIAGWEAVRSRTSPEGLVVLLNNDTEAHPSWLEALHQAGRAYPKAGIFASKMMMFDDRGTIENCGFALTSVGFPIDLGRGEADSPAWLAPRPVFGACAGAAAYRRLMLDDVGFLDNDFFMTTEDIDLSFRAQLRGYECWMIPSAIVYHRYRATMTKFPARQTFFTQRNAEFFYWKNMPASLILQYLPLRLLHEIGAAIYYLRSGAGVTFLKAKADALRHVLVLLRKRREIQARRTLTATQLKGLLLKTPLWPKWRKFLSAWTVSPQTRPGVR